MAFGGLTKGNPLLNIGNTSIIKNITGGLDKVGSILGNASNARLQTNGLFKGAFGNQGGNVPNINFLVEGQGANAGSAISADQDWRVRITAPTSGPFDFGSGPLLPLAEDNGVVFPITPTVTVSHNANYGSASPTHSNYPNYFYNYSTVDAVNITAEFIARTSNDASYVLAMVWFFRSATKMFYGGENAGNPPPILYLDGYGDFHLPHVPVVVKNFSHSMPNNVDYIETKVSPSLVTEISSFGGDTVITPTNTVGFGLASAENIAAATARANPSESRTVSSKGSSARIPTKSTINLQVQPVYSRNNISNKFTWEDFSKGNLLKGNGGFL